MNQLEAIQAIRSLIIDYMGVGQQRIWISGERQEIPKDKKLFITLSAGAVYNLSNSETFNVSEDTVTHETLMAADVAVEVASRGVEAIERHPEIIQAISTGAALIDMEQKGYHAYRSARTQDLSAIAGTGVLRRFRVPISLQYIQRKTVAADVYDKFRDVVPVEEG